MNAYTNEYEFTVYGHPTPKERPRFNHYTKTPYTPHKTQAYETAVRYSFLAKFKKPRKAEGYIEMRLQAYFEPPKSVSKTIRESMLLGEIRPDKRPDADNIIKAICDALNGLAYLDDKQVVSISLDKWYGEKEKVVVWIGEVA